MHNMNKEWSLLNNLKNNKLTMPPIELNVTEPLLIQQQRYLTQLAANAAQINQPPAVLSSPRSSNNSPNSSFNNNTNNNSTVQINNTNNNNNINTNTFNPQLQQMATPVQRKD
eukprot:UN07710